MTKQYNDSNILNFQVFLLLINQIFVSFSTEIVSVRLLFQEVFKWPNPPHSPLVNPDWGQKRKRKSSAFKMVNGYD